jgi:LPXTG-motif cell wall-anchored protein
MWRRTGRSPTRESNMDTNTLLIIIVLVLLLGGGGFAYRGRRR